MNASAQPHYPGSPFLRCAIGNIAPPYTPLHAFVRYKLLGARYVYRAQFVAFRWRYRRLSTSQHPAAFMARTALAHGLFLDAEGDVLTDDPYTSSPDFDALDRFLGSPRGDGAPAGQILPLLDGARPAVFERFSRLAIDVRRAGLSGAFHEYHRVLDAVDHPNGWAARVALAHGLFIEAARISADYARIQHFLPAAPGLVA